jgi:uncharacterized protein GlcG (DUF336 family)
MSISLDKANAIIAAAFETARAHNMTPLTIAVLDTGGHVVALQRQDNSGNLRPDIATGKAWGALGMGYGSRQFVERAAKTPAFYAALAAMSGGKVVPVPGGVLIVDGQKVIGAVGVSGDTSDRDEQCAIAGIEAAGFTARPE